MPLDNILLTPPELPGGDQYCFVSYQRLAVDIISRTKGELRVDIGVGWNYGATTPTPEMRAYPWFNTVYGLPFFFNQAYGLWTAPARVQVGPNGLRQFWTGPVDGSAAGLWTYDYGDGTDPASGVTPTSGSFWEVDTAMSGKFALGAGTLSPSGTIVATGATGGADQVQLTVDQLAAHTHLTKISRDTADDIAESTIAGEGTGISQSISWVSDSAGGDEAHPNMPPYYVGVWIKRTIRQWISIPG